MSFMEWNDKMSVGVESLDKDHQKLMKMVNELHDAMKAGHGKEPLGKILDALTNYTRVHFAREERFFVQTDYPAAAEHKKQHDELTRQVVDVQQKYKDGATSLLTVEVMNFLKDWLLNHIQGSDKKYGPYLNSKGIH
jgi:hemerythrin-like metal-binding protein